MKTRRLVYLLALLATLTTARLPASAEESGNGVGSSLGSHTIGGSVDTSTGGGVSPSPHHEGGGWWHQWLHRLGFYRHG